MLAAFQYKIGFKLGNGFAQALPIIVFGHQQNAVAKMMSFDDRCAAYHAWFKAA